MASDTQVHSVRSSADVVLASAALCVGYGEAVCAPLDLTVHAGECVALVGPNGCGKSTVLRTIAGQLRPLVGEVIVGEGVAPSSAAFRAGVSVDLDEDTYLPALTAREHLSLVAFGHGQTSQESVDHWIDEFGLSARQHALPNRLSSGQRRRLLLAAAFIRPWWLGLFDEPEQRLDPPMRERLGHLLLTRKAHGSAVVLATHDPALVSAAADRVIVLGENANQEYSPSAAPQWMAQL